MAIEHTCQRCAASLTRVRAPADPVYGLPIVVCPECGLAVVRRRHPLAVAWRMVCHTKNTVWGLAWRTAVIAVMAIATAGTSHSLARSLEDLGIRDLAAGLFSASPDSAVQAWRDDFGIIILIITLGWFVIVGALLTAGLRHESKRWLVWLLFFLLVCAILIGAPLLDSLDRALSAHHNASLKPPWIRWGRDDTRGLVAFALVAPFSVVGLPIGIRLRRAFAGYPARRYCRILARARQRRSNL